MAQLLQLLKDFENGNGTPINQYASYATDMDNNFTSIEVVVNQLRNESNASIGTTAVLVTNLIEGANVVSTKTGSGFVIEGRIGADSLTVTISPSDTVTLAAGQFYAGSRIDCPQAVYDFGTLFPSDPADDGTYYIAIDTNGVPQIPTKLINQSFKDIWTVDWDVGTNTVSNAVSLMETLVDGNDFQRCLRPTGHASSGVPANQIHDEINKRFENIERLMRGVLTNAQTDGAALKPMAIGGSAGAPGLILSDGTTYDTTTGLYRLAANLLGVAVSGTANALFSAGQVLVNAGTEALPGVAGIADSDTGIEWPGSNVLNLITAGSDALTIDADGAVNLPSQPRARVKRSSTFQNIADAANADVSFDTEEVDIGGLWVSGTAITVPKAGWYQMNGWIQFDESSSSGTANSGDRKAGFSLNGTLIEGQVQASYPATGAGDTRVQVSEQVQLSASDVIRLVAYQDSGGTMDIKAVCTIKLDA